MYYSYNLFLSTPDRACVCACIYKGDWWFILVHLAIFVRPISSLHGNVQWKIFLFWLPMCWWQIFIPCSNPKCSNNLHAQISNMLFYLIDYINGNKRCFLLLQILIRKKLLNDGGGRPPDRGLPWWRTGVPAVICGKAHGIFFLFWNTELTRAMLQLPASKKFSELLREQKRAGMFWITSSVILQTFLEGMFAFIRMSADALCTFPHGNFSFTSLSHNVS